MRLSWQAVIGSGALWMTTATFVLGDTPTACNRLHYFGRLEVDVTWVWWRRSSKWGASAERYLLSLWGSGCAPSDGSEAHEDQRECDIIVPAYELVACQLWQRVLCVEFAWNSWVDQVVTRARRSAFLMVYSR